jgi:hypothetical protein
VPAPAVIPAPKAYINAVAVKGFVVELWAFEIRRSRPYSSSNTGRFPLNAREHPKQISRNCHYPSTLALNVRRRASAFFTVTKKMRLKQSFDMNWKAWDNNAAACGQPL